jgi:hypothetical protein
MSMLRLLLRARGWTPNLIFSSKLYTFNPVQQSQEAIDYQISAANLILQNRKDTIKRSITCMVIALFPQLVGIYNRLRVYQSKEVSIDIALDELYEQLLLDNQEELAIRNEFMTRQFINEEQFNELVHLVDETTQSQDPEWLSNPGRRFDEIHRIACFQRRADNFFIKKHANTSSDIIIFRLLF